MAEKPSSSIISLMEVSRVKSLSDSIFAFVMTLLIIAIKIPEIPQAKAPYELTAQLFSEWPSYATYIITFLHISNYWIIHHAIYENILYTNKTLLRLNTFFLLSVTFLPFPTALMGKYGKLPQIALIYGGIISINYFFLVLIARYTISHQSFLKNIPYHKLIRARLIIPFVLALIGTLLSFYFTRLSFLFYFCVSLSQMLPDQFLLTGFKNETKQ